jgi:hypothetical protein
MNPDSSSVQYPPEQWLKDFSFLLTTARKFPREKLKSSLENYFLEFYPDDKFSLENRCRLTASFNYFMKHLEDFNIEDIGVVGESGSLISDHLIIALYRVFAVAPLDRLEEDFGIDKVIELAREQKRFHHQL